MEEWKRKRGGRRRKGRNKREKRKKGKRRRERKRRGNRIRFVKGRDAVGGGRNFHVFAQLNTPENFAAIRSKVRHHARHNVL